MERESASVLQSAEAALVQHTAGTDAEQKCPVLFVLGAPRTGSTVFFQVLLEAFGLPHFSNLTNTYFSKTPVLGLAIQAGIGKAPQVDFASRFGKTTGLLQPSEGSLVMKAWFGGGHPSQLASTAILPGELPHLRDTLRAAHALFGKPLAIKNAWNCFRVPNLAELLPEALFIWIRRDIAAAAKSDLNARYVTKGSPTEWNSATPHNFESLRARPYWEQVVENQYEFSVALERDLNAHAQGRFREYWYEDFCSDPSVVLRDIAETWPSLGPVADLGPRRTNIQRSTERWSLPGNDGANIDAYVRAEGKRLGPTRYRSERDVTRSPGVTPAAAKGWRFRCVTADTLAEYLRADWVRNWLTEHSRPDDESLTSQRWLVEAPAKRHIFAELYGDLLQTRGRRILDVAGGLSAFTREFANRHEYELVEVLAHDQVDGGNDGRFGKYVMHDRDWLNVQPTGPYDVILANDLLPNVDQRLELFLRKFLPCSRELRLSLTFFDEPRYYRTRRTDGDEILFMLAWTWEQVGAAIQRVGGKDLVPNLRLVGAPSPSVFPNRRQVVLLTVRQ